MTIHHSGVVLRANRDAPQHLREYQADHQARGWPDIAYHLVMDNYAAHKHKDVREWLEKNPRFVVHFTPTHASWMNLVEVWFGIVERQAIRRGVFKSVKDLNTKIRAFIDGWNGLLSGRFGDDGDDWRSAGWWRQGLSDADRRELGGMWVLRDDLEWPWQAATFGTMQKIIERHGSLVAQACRDSDAKGFLSDVRKTANVRNALVHPLGGEILQEDDFELVARALEDLVSRCRVAVKGGFLRIEDLPTERALLLPSYSSGTPLSRRR